MKVNILLYLVFKKRFKTFTNIVVVVVSSSAYVYT